MTINSSTHTRRHALKLSLLYLLIRGTPELFAGLWGFLPQDTRVAFFESSAAWLHYLFPPVPPTLLTHVPYGFQSSLNGLSGVFIETALVFIFAAWGLKHRSGAVHHTPGRKAWWVMILATLVWSVVVRQVVLGFMVRLQMKQLDSSMSYEAVSTYLTSSYWVSMPVFYLSTLVWAWVPVWLHYRAWGTPDGSSSEVISMAPALKRACVLASFVLGFMVLHYGLLQAFVMGLWPWLAEANDIHIPFEELEKSGLPLTLSQVITPMLAGLIAAFVFSRNGGHYADNRLKLITLPILAGIVTLALANAIVLVLFWIVSYVSYDLVFGLLLSVAYQPEMGYVLLAVFNILSVLLLCAVAAFLRGARSQTPSTSTAGLSQA